MTPTRLSTAAYPEPPELDTAISHASLLAVATGATPDLFRIYTPARVVAFGRQDTHAPGYQQAVAACRTHGFTPVVRLAGGRAAVFHEATLAFSWQMRTSQPKLGIIDRFESITDLLQTALGSLGLGAIVGEIPGEYCPGRYSLHVGGRKVIGIGQRLVEGAAHIGGVIVVDDATAINRVLLPVYEALAIEWDPTTTGALADFGVPNLDAVAAAVISELGRRVDLVDGDLASELVESAANLIADHRPSGH